MLAQDSVMHPSAMYVLESFMYILNVLLIEGWEGGVTTNWELCPY